MGCQLPGRSCLILRAMLAFLDAHLGRVK